MQPPADVAVVGVGGGRDILSALYFGAKRIRGIEINPRYSKSSPTNSPISPAISIAQPGVSLVNAEARSYINHSSDRYDLVQISLIDTWAATAAGGLTLTENRLYTVEAWGDFYRALKPGGLLSVSRWYEPDRFTAASSIAWWRSPRARCSARACPQPSLPDHVVALNVGNIVTVITRPDAFTDRANGRVRARGFWPRASRSCWGRMSPSMP